MLVIALHVASMRFLDHDTPEELKLANDVIEYIMSRVRQIRTVRG